MRFSGRSLILLFLLMQIAGAQNLWFYNQRTHPELEWSTIQTDHFRIHYHQGLETTAGKAARIAEQSYQPILDQLQLDDFGVTDIVLSAEDEVMNGFAMPSNQIFIWVSQNDVAGGFGGSEKWLRLVISHEFQHVAQFQAHRTWAGLFSAVSLPAWWMEGMAEYMTERWRVGRSDSRMKIHTYRNTMDRLDPHDDGYAMVLYLAWKHGDSTLVKISNHRIYLDSDKQKWPIWYDFGTAFKDVTGQSVKQFREEWRRVMNAYYYAYLAQKESVEETGVPFPLSEFHQVHSLSISPDATQLAVVGRRHKHMLDQGLYLVSLDSSRTIRELHDGRFSGQPAWSPENERLAVAEYHRGKHGSLIYDLREVEVASGKTRWLTRDFRAHHPDYHPDGEHLLFVAHPAGETTQLYQLKNEDLSIERLSRFQGDVQLKHTTISPAGDAVAFMIQDTTGDVDIAVFDLKNNTLRKVTRDHPEDMAPVWTADGKQLIFTSYRNSTPNLYRVDVDSLEQVQMTDVAQGIYSLERIPKTGDILAMTLPDVDTVRVMQVDPQRVAQSFPVNIRDRYQAWRNHSPAIQIPRIDYNRPMEISDPTPYRALPTFRRMIGLVLPDETGLGGFVALNDALGKHMIQGGAEIGWDGEMYGGYLGYLNLQYTPAIQIYAARNFFLGLRSHENRDILEAQNGAGAMFMLPFGGRNGLAANHQVMSHLRFFERQQLAWGRDFDWYEGEDYPEQMTESSLGFTYRYKHMRPHRRSHSLPQNGWGVLAHWENTFPGLWGNLDYGKVWLDGFVNVSIPKTPLVVYGRLKWEQRTGTPPPSDYIGLVEDPFIAFSPGTVLGMVQEFLLDIPETYSMRGQTGNHYSREVVVNTMELRWPMIQDLPVSFFGVELNNLTGALFTDLGYIPDSERLVFTTGPEVKFDLSIADLPLVVLAAGVGIQPDGPNGYVGGSGYRHKTYFRMSLVNPF